VGLEMTITSKSIVRYVWTKESVRPEEKTTEDPKFAIPVAESIETKTEEIPKLLETSAKVKIAEVLSTRSEAKLNAAILFSKTDVAPNTGVSFSIVTVITESGPVFISIDPVPL
jgi:hypothetical protein